MHYIPTSRCNWKYLKRLASDRGGARLQNEAYNNVFALNLTDTSQIRSFLWLRIAVKVMFHLIKLLPAYTFIVLSKKEGDYREIEFLSEWARLKEYLKVRNGYLQYHAQIIEFKKRLAVQ